MRFGGWLVEFVRDLKHQLEAIRSETSAPGDLLVDYRVVR
jgi:hypothetical protein